MKNKKNQFFKTIKIIFVILLLCSLLTVNPIQAFAVGSPPNITAEPYGQSKPGTAWDFSEGAYFFSGVANISDLYSNYYFTGISRVKIYVKNSHASKTLTVKLLKQQKGVDFAVSEEKIEHGEYKEWTVSLDSSKIYILKFYAPSDFYGSIASI